MSGLWDQDAQTRRAMEARLFGRVQEHAMRAAHKFVTGSPVVLPPEFRLAVLKCRPNILDCLLDCMLLERPKFFPESIMGFLTCSTLSALFSCPLYSIPGVPTPNDGTFLSRGFKSVSQALQILTAQKEWSERIIGAYLKLEDEEDLAPSIALRENIRNLDVLLPEDPGRKKFYDDVMKNLGM
ncbi:hypothetical protein CONPUDRAFT_160044 [Coniophora puteana RWD-64-598 SS2]|uniref:Uncharacterized protein n=1 Tax=Coniophora puteana (strain RWD-64-598) TaxID=741705 RepID=R7SH03_CONPW|nr:uncharacterized protein CONPUDRAFT_160044 [Coniophora puteana RWD-64-598 SS2]EIW74334.1 hypothetical protein CONPUDRAFT_160044 [Coniophora puteana RWD-64-598 SS2]